MPSFGYMLTLLSQDRAITGAASFPPEFPAFQGHFPGNPILPACMHIQAALDLLALAGLPAELAAVQNAKFTKPIKPEQSIRIHITPTSPDAFHSTLTVANETVSHFDLHTHLP